MKKERVEEILGRFKELSIAVVGDFFLDRYIVIDRSLSEISLETGLEAYQVVQIRSSPGAAGTVTSNIAALEVGKLYAVGAIGFTGEGYELKKGLTERGVDIRYLIESESLFTPTYMKPMMREGGKEREINRMDIKNRARLPKEIEDRIISIIHELLPEVNGIVVADQVQERNCGIITDRVREEIGRIGGGNPEKVITVDSRCRIGEFRNCILKPNRFEAARAIYPDHEGDVDMDMALKCGKKLREIAGRPVFVTMGEKGVLVFEEERPFLVPGYKVSGEIDIVGAGDSVMAGIALTLCSGGSCIEAAIIGNLVASITIQQIGTTGTASPAQVLSRFEEWMDQVQGQTALPV
jgi:rfaE bifunctional protein kinase chain/domain